MAFLCILLWINERMFHRKFEYLKYPDLGIGTSKRNQPDEFMRRGLGLALDPITELLISVLRFKLFYI
ncbi:hypothetical protein EfmAA96_08480 [Enterococcus faecium]|nr:hypothetical protein EfmAA96_08480 [Enterococcus faecium]